jgi:N-acetylglucosamine kinase-like BadF-type ATPase
MDADSQPPGASLGVDGGAGRLKLAVLRPDGVVVHHHAPGANPNLVGMTEFLRRLEDAVHGALKAGELTPDRVLTAGFGLSGVDRPDQIEQLTREIPLRLLPACRRLWIGNDAMAALRQGAGALRGLILIAGTGSICFGVDPTGAVVRVGGWGSDLGDEGSAYWIGLKALQAACRMADGRIPRSSLLNVVLHEMELDTPEALVSWAAQATREAFKQQAAALFPAVASLALGGDAESVRILDDARSRLVDHVQAVLERLPPAARAAPGPLVCAGGIFAGNESFYEDFVDALRARFPALETTRLVQPASLGALDLGREAADLRPRSPA